MVVVPTLVINVAFDKAPSSEMVDEVCVFELAIVLLSSHLAD